MKRQKRIRQCPNCSCVLKITDNFCPQCGQENHYHDFSLREL
ncbi:MAG: hypothetical protein Q4G08_10635 [Capnocytophaga sp.]|nr:hypothetical protein [Capnocytophaga sp.]